MKAILRLLLILFVVIAVVAAVRVLTPAFGDTPEAAIDALGQPFRTSPAGTLGTATTLGFMLLGGWLTGLLFSHLNLPRVSGYLLFGVVCGPSAAAAMQIDAPVISADHLTGLSLINALAISFIALTAGGEIRVDYLRRGLRQILTITFIEMAFVIVGVAGMLWLLHDHLSIFEGLTARSTLVICLFIATLAIANSPAIVMALLSETGARGTMAQSALTITIIKDMVLILFFTIVVSIGYVILGKESNGPAVSVAGLAGYLAWHLVGSIGFGALLGVVLTFLVRRIGDQTPVFVLAAALGIALVSDAIDLEPLLVSLSAGFVMANLWPEHSAKFFHSIGELGVPVLCVFFVAAGAKVDLIAVSNFWPLALLIVAVRVPSIIAGTWVGARVTGLEAPARNWLWTALIPQAGVTIALITSLDRSFTSYEWSAKLASLLLTAVAIHEVAGPILMRYGLARCGEIGGQNGGTSSSSASRKSSH